MEYRVEYEPQAIKDLKQLPTPLRKRIVNKIAWLAENFESVKPLPLAGQLAGLYKLRVGDYRVVYEFDRGIRVITVDWVGHRRDVYKRDG